MLADGMVACILLSRGYKLTDQAGYTYDFAGAAEFFGVVGLGKIVDVFGSAACGFTAGFVEGATVVVGFFAAVCGACCVVALIATHFPPL